jgi:hypothetical protein
MKIIWCLIGLVIIFENYLMFNWSGYYLWKAKWINCNPRRTILVWTLLSTIVCDVLNFTKQNKTRHYFRNTSCDCFQFVTFKKICFPCQRHPSCFLPLSAWGFISHWLFSSGQAPSCLAQVSTHAPHLMCVYYVWTRYLPIVESVLNTSGILTRVEIFKPLLWRFLYFLYFYGILYLLSFD